MTGVVGYAETGDDRFISTAGDAAYVVVQLGISNEESVDQVEELRDEIQPPAGYTYQLTGYGPLTVESAEQSEKDLQRAELVSLPIAAVVLILVFGAVLAAGMPLFVAGLAIPASLALIYLVAQQVEMSIYVLNIATMLGLALAIDYSLFITSRFREELRRGRTVGEAVERAVATAGKAVVFSGLAVAIGLSGLLLFAAPAIRSIGIGGSIVVLTSVLFALTFLPGVPRHARPAGQLVVARRPAAPLPAGRPRADRRRARSLGARRHGVMRHPIAVLVPTLAVLLLAGIPFLQLRAGRAGRRGQPARPREPRRVRRARDRIRRRRDDADHHPGRRSGLAHVGRDIAALAAYAMSWTRSRASTGSRARSRSATRRPAPS